MEDTMANAQKSKLTLIAGPCLIDSRETAYEIARELKRVAEKYDINPIFKGSFKKANRSTAQGFSGIDQIEALSILREIRDWGMNVITDVHETTDVPLVADYVTHLQVPAYLCRQTDLVLKCSDTGLPTNLKKGQFVSPEACKFMADKFRSGRGKDVMITERGFSFGYNDLVVDATGVPRMQQAAKCPIIIDCTHSLQKPNMTTGTGSSTATLLKPLPALPLPPAPMVCLLKFTLNPKLHLPIAPILCPCKNWIRLLGVA